MNKIIDLIRRAPLGLTVFVYFYAAIATIAMVVMGL
jgi:hypothetical protein